MRVLFIERNLRNEKLGIMYLSASLKQNGHHADLIQTDKEDLDSFIKSYQPDFVAFSITTGEHLYALQIAKHIKQKYQIPNIFGGPHCTFFPEIGYDEAVDYVVQGQGEQAIVDIVEGRVNPGFHKSDMVPHLDQFAFPDREIIYKYKEFRDNPVKNVITSRACPYRCSYCFNHSQLALSHIDNETKEWFDRRSVANVIEEITELKNRYPLEKVLFIDDSFIQKKGWLHQFLDEYTEQVKIPWMCSLRVNCLDDKLAKKMFESGLEMVNYAMESADPDVQQRLLHRGHITNGDIIHAISLFDQYGIRARMQNMIGLPLTNTLDDALNTLQFNMHHRVTDSWCSIFQAYPRTALGQYCVDNGFTSSEQLQYCSESFFDESRLNIDHKNELYALQKLWYFIIDASIPMDLTQILIRAKFSQKIGDELQKLRYACSREKLYGIKKQAESATDLQSREKIASVHQSGALKSTNESELGAAGSLYQLLQTALENIQVPDELVKILAKADFSQQQIEQLKRYNAGEQVYPETLYTIDDKTGELKQNTASIFEQGTPEADKKDIRKMAVEKFMSEMTTVREDLVKGSVKKIKTYLGNKSEQKIIWKSDDNKDERHLNQFLS